MDKIANSSAVVVLVEKSSIQRKNAHIITTLHMTWKGYNATVVNFFALTNGLI